MSEGISTMMILKYRQVGHGILKICSSVLDFIKLQSSLWSFSKFCVAIVISNIPHRTHTDAHKCFVISNAHQPTSTSEHKLVSGKLCAKVLLFTAGCWVFVLVTFLTVGQPGPRWLLHPDLKQPAGQMISKEKKQRSRVLKDYNRHIAYQLLHKQPLMQKGIHQ